MRIDRRSRRGLLHLLLSVGLFLGVVAVGAGTANAAPCTTACLALSSESGVQIENPGDTVPLRFSLAVPATTTAATWTLTSTADVAIDSASLTVNGAPVASTPVTGGYAVNLTTGGPLAPGTYALAAQGVVSTTASTDQSAAAEVSWTSGVDQFSTGPIVVQIPLIQPDYQVEPFISGPIAVPGGYGATVGVSVAQSNSAPAGVHAKITATASAGFTISAADPGCVLVAAAVSCPVKASGFTDVSVGIRADAATRVGTTGSVTFVVTVTDGPAEQTPADNTAVVPVVSTGSAAITATFDKNNASLPIGQTLTYTVTFTNNGPNPAVDAELRVGQGGPNTYVSETVNGVPVPAGFRLVYAGTMAVGQKVIVRITITAHAIDPSGRPYYILATAQSSSYDPFPCTPEGCELRGRRLVTVVPAAAVVPAPTTPPATATTAAELADTGAATGPWPAIGLALLAGGALLQRRGRRRTG